MKKIEYILGVLLLGLNFVGFSMEKPNVVFFLVDDFSWGALSSHGSNFHETPNIDKLARSGMTFTNGYAACTVCSPSRAAILTGCYPARTHLTDWIAGHRKPFEKLKVPDWNMKIDHERVVLPEALKELGYSTSFIGKWHLLPHRDKDLMKDHFPESHGFDQNIGGREWGQPKGRGKYMHPFDMPNVTSKEGDYLTDRLTDYAVEFIDQQENNPFFLYFSYYTVHGPLMAKPELIAKYKAKSKTGKFKHTNPVYAAMVQSLDESVGRVLDKLEDVGKANKTIVLFTGDNGAVGNNYCAGLRGAKGYSFEGGVREPFFIRGPGIPVDSFSEVPVIAMDFYPTILDLVGVPLKPDQHKDGLSLKPLLHQTGGIEHRSLFWHYPHYHKTMPYGAIRQGNYKLIEFFENGALELYDLEKDPSEKNNLTKKMPEKSDELLGNLEKWRLTVGAQKMSENPNYDPSKAGKGLKW